MPTSTTNNYLSSLLDDLVATYETELNYAPLVIKLDAQKLKDQDITTLLTFVQEPRKRLFIFDIPENKAAAKQLQLTARRAMLDRHARTMLENTSNEPKINPLKKTLGTNTTGMRASIQIQKSLPLPKQVLTLKKQQDIIEESIQPQDLVLLPPAFPLLPELNKQLEALGITGVEEQAALLIQQNTHAFTDGIIPNNLPYGFYINYEKHTLCYTDKPKRLPSLLAPILENPTPIAEISLEEARLLAPSLTDKTRADLLDSSNLELQKNALFSALPNYRTEVSKFILAIKPEEVTFIVPLLAKLLLIGGEAHTALFVRQLQTCLRKKISLDFLINPQAQAAFLNPHGIKNLQKLLSLPTEQQDWWNTLVKAHLINDQHHFDFNVYFEAYTQVFLPAIAEKKLTLPHPCPIEHQGHFLITLNRIMDVLQNAEYPQEQCFALKKLNWNATAIPFAINHPDKALRFKQVAECMQINDAKDADTNPLLIYQQLTDAHLNLQPWIYRYFGQHWKANLRLSDIQTQLAEIQHLASWNQTDKNQLMFILACTFSEQNPFSSDTWKQALKNCISLLQATTAAERSLLLHSFSSCFQFKPVPSLSTVQELMQLCMELKKSEPDSIFDQAFIEPLITCLKSEGFELFHALQERIEKTVSVIVSPPHPEHSEGSLSTGTVPYSGDPSPQAPQDDLPGATMAKIETTNPNAKHKALLSFIRLVHANRQNGALPKLPGYESFGVLPAQAGIHLEPSAVPTSSMDPRLCGDDNHENSPRAKNGLPFKIITLLAKLNEPNFEQNSIDQLLRALAHFQQNKSENYYQLLINTLSQLNCLKSNPVPNAAQITLLIHTLANLEDTLPDNLKNTEQELWLKDLIFEKKLQPGCVFGIGDISKLDDLLVDALVDAVKKRSFLLDMGKLKSNLRNELQSRLVPQGLRDQLENELMPMLDAANDLFTMLQESNPSFEKIIQKLNYFETKKVGLFTATYNIGILGSSTGEFILSYLTTGETKKTDTITGNTIALALKGVHKLLVGQINDFFSKKSTQNLVKDLDAAVCLSWMRKFNENHSITFFFKEDIIDKKIIPALEKTLQQLNTNDPEFENTILSAARELAEQDPSDIALQQYKDKVESIAQYLKLLSEINNEDPALFKKVYTQLNTGVLTRLTYPQKQSLLNKIYETRPKSLTLFLTLFSEILEDNPEADAVAIERAKNGLIDLFNLNDLEAETQIMFFKMSAKHNLKYPSPFPLASLNELKKSAVSEEIKPQITKQITRILSQMDQPDSALLIDDLVKQTQAFLIKHPELAPLCLILLDRISSKTLNQDLSIYPNILQQLSLLPQEHRTSLCTILGYIAKNKKDEHVYLASLLELIKGLARRTADIDRVLHLFDNPPYPLIHHLNSALLDHGSEKLTTYCLNFDKNPFISNGKPRKLAEQFTSSRIEDALLNLRDLIKDEPMPHALQLKLARQLVYIETLGYVDPLHPEDFSTLKKLTDLSRVALKNRASVLLSTLRTQSKALSPQEIELTQLELLAYMREIYFRTTGLFPNSTQMLVLLLSLLDTKSNLLMRIRTGEGKSINTPMLSVLQWTLGGTVVQFTANSTLLHRDYTNSCEPFYQFLGIDSALIQDNTDSTHFIKNGINCSTIEDMAFFELIRKELNPTQNPIGTELIHTVIDECDDPLLDLTLDYKLVQEQSTDQSNNFSQWIYPLAYQFIRLPGFRNLDPARGAIWDEEEDLVQFRLFINKAINEQYKGDVDKQNFLMAATNTQLLQWIHASCKAELLIENKHYIIKSIKTYNEAGIETGKKNLCVPLIRSTPKVGAIFTEGVHQALQARLNALHKNQSHDNTDYFVINNNAKVFASQSARGLIEAYLKTKGRLIGISGTPGDRIELMNLETLLGIQAIGVAPYAGDQRTNHAPVFTFSNEETIKAIHEAIDRVRLPITQPFILIDPTKVFQTYEEKEAFINKALEEKERWSLTQTQPILIINEAFNDAQKVGASLAAYKQAGFTIQIVTGKESDEELNQIIKQAGQANTITVGTAILAKGIDINIGDHPKGLMCIQTYPDSERMNTQIAGRAARKGKKGEWLPIYPITPPEHFITQFLHFIMPKYKQQSNERAIAVLTEKIKLQMTVDRLYTQAIDEAQQTLMQQINAWEDILRELYPDDANLGYELYEWRERILSELNRLQETKITPQNLQSSIIQFKKAAAKLWENIKEIQWVAKAQQANAPSTAQNLRLNYLKQLNITQEFDVQSALRAKSQPFTAATQALMHQNIRTIIADQAGAVLHYGKPSAEEKQGMQLAQCAQLLPSLIGDFCGIYPSATKKLLGKNQIASYIPKILGQVFDRVLEQKDRLLIKPAEREALSLYVMEQYQKNLQHANIEQIHNVLKQFKPLFLDYNKSLANASLMEQFKMQGLVLTFNTLYQNSGLPADTELAELKTSFHEDIMKKIAEHLKQEFIWVKKSPQLYHAFLERSAAKKAANLIYDSAEQVSAHPDNEELIHSFYQVLQEQRMQLKDKYLFSIAHRSPRQVINEALMAIDSLDLAPHCEPAFRADCHDTVLARHHLTQFRSSLNNTSPYYLPYYDPVWEHLRKTLRLMSEEKPHNQSYVLQELYEATERFSTYKAYQPYVKQLKALGRQLSASLKTLNKPDGFKLDTEALLLNQKAKQFAELFEVPKHKVCIQKGNDGLQSIIEVQIKNKKIPLQTGFSRYQSTFLPTIETEKQRLTSNRDFLKTNEQAFRELSNSEAGAGLSEKQTDFKQLFHLRGLLAQDWNNEALLLELSQIPYEPLTTKLKDIQKLHNAIDVDAVQAILARDPDPVFRQTITGLTELKTLLLDAQSDLDKANAELQRLGTSIEDKADQLKQTQQQLAGEYTLWQRLKLEVSKRTIQTKLVYNNSRSNRQNQTVQSLDAEVTSRKEAIQFSLDENRDQLVSILLEQAKTILRDYLTSAASQGVTAIGVEHQRTEETLNSIKKEEQSKSKYQTQRFFSVRGLLDYEAQLKEEESQICLKRNS